MGWGGIVTSHALPHICDATYLYALLHFIHIHTYVMLRFCKLVGTSTHASCYAVGTLALLHMRHATLPVLLHFHTYVMLRCRYSCTSIHVSCSAAVDSLALPHVPHATL